MKQSILILLSILLVSPAFAKRERGEGRMRIFKQLDLSDKQKESLKEIRKSRKDKMKSLREKKKAAGTAFQDGMTSNLSNSKLKSLHKKMLNSNHDFKSYRFETMLKTRSLLTDAQKKKFSELKSQHRKHRKHRGDND